MKMDDMLRTLEEVPPIRRVLDDWLFPRGYRRTQPPGFEPWNHLYEAADRP